VSIWTAWLKPNQERLVNLFAEYANTTHRAMKDHLWTQMQNTLELAVFIEKFHHFLVF